MGKTRQGFFPMTGKAKLPESNPVLLSKDRRRAVLAGCTVAVMGLVLLTTALIRLRLLSFPLERDEGEYAYMGQLLLQGIVPYGESVSMKWPGTYLIYAAIMVVFGQTTAGIHAGLVVTSLAASLLLFLLGRRIAGTVCGSASAAACSALSIGTPTLGLAAHATHFVVVCALGGFVLLTGRRPTAPWRLLASGLLFGFACVVKQTGAVFGVLAVIWIAWQSVVRERAGLRRTWARLAALVGGALLPLAITGLWLWGAGVWANFWFWTVVYSRTYASLVTFAEGMDSLGLMATNLFLAAPVLWVGAALGLAVILRWHATREWRGFTVGMLVLSFAGVSAGLYFRGHYFILIMPAVALLIGVSAAGFAEWIAGRQKSLLAMAIPGVLLLGGIAHALWVGREVFFRLSPTEACRTTYYPNPFPEAVQIGQYLREHARPDARIAVVGSEPEIYFYARRRAATPFLYVYPLVELQPFSAKMQAEFAQGIETADPDYVVFVSVPHSWLAEPESNRDVFRWFGQYAKKHQHEVGMIEILSPHHTEFRWEGDPVELRPRTAQWVAVLRNNRLR